MAYLHCNQIGSPVYIRCSEAQQAEVGAEEARLLPV
jgi:hypothetical protein